MAINFSVNDIVIVNQGYVSITLGALTSLTARNATSILGSFGRNILTVANTGNIDGKSFIRLVPPTGHPKYNNGQGLNVFFENDEQLNDSLELSSAFFCDYLYKKVLNSSGSTLPKDSVVYQTGFDTTSQLPTVDLASAAAAPTACCSPRSERTQQLAATPCAAGHTRRAASQPTAGPCAACA